VIDCRHDIPVAENVITWR